MAKPQSNADFLAGFEAQYAQPNNFLADFESQYKAPTGVPDTGFTGAFKSSTESLKGEAAILAAKLGLKDEKEAEAYRAKQEALAKSSFAPTEKGWTEAPLTKLAETAGGSLPYMAAPAAAALGTLALPEELLAAGVAGGVLSIADLAAGATSAAQFTGTNLARQMDEGKKLSDTSLLKAGAAAVPQAALDIVGFHMLPGIKNIFSKAGVDLTEKAAQNIAKKSLLATAGEYTLKTGKVMSAEGLTEAGQQVFERMQAGLNLTDPQARQEYFDNFVGGAALGGALSIPGHIYEKLKQEQPQAGLPTEQVSNIPPVPVVTTPEKPQAGIPPVATSAPVLTDADVEDLQAEQPVAPVATAPIVPTPVATTPTPAPVVQPQAPVAQQPSALPEGWEHYETKNPDGTITSGARRIPTATPVETAPVSPNTPLHTVVNNETKMEASVYPRDDGTFNVAQKDLESGETLDTFKNFKTQEEAIKYAETIKTPVAPKPTEVVKDTSELEKKVSSYYQDLLDKHPDASEGWKSAVQELAGNPNRYHKVEEQENPKGIKVGDTVISGFGKTAQTNTVLSVTKDKALIDSGEPNRYGGWTDLDQLNQPNVEPTQLFKDSNKTFNFGTGEIDVSLTRMGVSPETYKNIYKEDGGILSFDLRGDGLSSETGYRSASGISYTGKMTPERLEEIMLSVAQEHSKKPKLEKPKTQAQINQERQQAKKEAAKKASEYVDTSAVSDVIVKSIKKKDGYVIYKRESDPEFWLVQSPENKAKNRIGNGDTPHANLGTATDQIYENLNNEQLVQKPVKETPNLIKAAEDIGKLEIVTVTDKKPVAKPTSNYDIDTAKKDLDDALSDLGSILSASTRANIMPEEEQKLIPVLVRVMDAAFRLGYYKFKDASKFVLDTIRNKFGKDVADKISLDHLQGAYISMAGRYEEADSKRDVANVDSLDEITQEAKHDLSNADSRFKASNDIADFFIGGGKFSNIVEARKKIAEILGLNPILPGTNEAKQADETVESAIVIAGRKTVEESRKSGLTTQQTYDKLLDLYNRQPNLSMRSSTSVRDQAYSTPLPLAYVASEFAGINDKTTVLEPTAGNGMLLVGANPKNVTANELNPSRSEMIKLVIPEADVTTDNATTITYDKKFDAVIENPPFGSVRDDKSKTITFDINPNYKTIDIDHAIVMKSLEAMKDNGRAVLIVGGTQAETEDARREDYRGKSKREFYYNLYKDYNVVDHFSISGSMYTKQGASFPVDFIVIDGRGKSSRNLPASELPKIIASYEQLKEKLNEASRMVPRGNIVTSGTNISPSTTGGTDREGLDNRPVGQGNRPSTEGTRPTTVSETGVQVPRPAVSGQPTTTGGNISEAQSGTKNIPVTSNERGGVPSTGETKSGSTTSAERSDLVGLGKPSEVRGEYVQSGLKDRRGLEEETSNQVTYNPYSQGTAIGTLVPRAMSESINNAIQKVQDEVGNLDNYVADALNMDTETLKEKFSAEQIDALVLAIRNAEAGKGFIIGDQTGVGKGRVVAAMIKYALVNDKIPIFVTEKPNLYSDMIRDLDDIGMTKELGLDTKVPKILMTNSSDAVPYSLIRNVKGEVVENEFTLRSPKSGASLNNLMSDMISKDSIGDYKVIFTTYSQLQTVKGKPTERQRFISNFAEGNYLICDESHNAGGTGDAKAKEGIDTSTGRANFVRNLVSNSFGSFFSSATYAKRPDVMDLYSSTNMSLAVDRPNQLAEAIKHGGIPMQQMVANMLTKDGQYIRRERTFAGVTYDTHETKVDKKTAENMATAMRKVLEFSRAKEPIVKDMQKDLDKAGAVASILGEKTTIQSANFGSIMHNLIDQMLLSLKVEDSINLAIEKLKAGEKVVMTVSNTMGSFLKDFAEENDINIGDEVNLSFKDVYQKYLQKQREVTIKKPDGTKEKYYLTDEDLGPRLTSMFNNTRDAINGFGFGSAPISPIDYLHSKLQQAGYTTDEITGRNNKLNYAGGTATYDSRSSNIKQRVNAVRNFNNGTTDVIILNQAGSTGLSLHASSKFKDQRKRNMIIVQPEKNIDTHMQMLGRVHRTGQIQTPSYYQMMADIPAEMRPAAVLLKKMASLNANTTASRKSAITAEGSVDFMNDYGGQVAQEYLRDNPDVSEAIGDRVDLKEDSTEGTEEDIRKFTGYIPILPIKQQEEIYKDLIDRYNDLIESENNLGTNKLEAKAMDLDAETISTVPITEHKGGTSVFAEPANMERIDIKRTVKPYSSEEVKADIKENLDGKTALDLAKEKNKDLFDRTKVYRDERLAKAREENADDVRLNTIDQQITTAYNHVRTINETYRIGDAISVKDSKGVFVYGVITNTNSSNRTANPSAPSDWKMHIALANGDAKSITLTFSQIDKQFTLEKQPYNVDWLNTETLKTEYIPVIDMFDKASTTRREKRWMVTGNILAGFALYPGQIVTFTKQDGSVSQGVLMSRNFDFEKEQKNAPVKIKSAEDVISSLNQFYRSSIGTLDNLLRISKDYQEYVFTVPNSKKSGGTYFLDKGLTDAIGNEFFKRGSIMNARAYGETNALRAINYIMQNRGEPLYAVTDQQKVKAYLYPKVESARGKARLTGQTAETVLQRLHGEFGKAGINSMMNRGLLTIVNNADELPANIKSEIDATTVAAHSEGKVYLIANRLEPDRVRSSLLHEIGEHYGLRAIVGEEAYSNILNEIDRLRPLDATVRDAFTHVEKMYPDLKGNRDRINREVLARVGEEAPQHSLWRKIVSAFKTFLIKHGFKTNLTTADIHDLVQYSLHKAMKGDIAQTYKSIDLAKDKTNIQTKTPEFKKWFGNSKVVDEDGNPLVVYHGTAITDINKFKPSVDTNGNLGDGIYFTESKDAASEFAKRAEKNALVDNVAQNVMPVYLKAENILNIDNLTKSDFDNLIKAIPKTLDGLRKLGAPQWSLEGVTGEITLKNLDKIHKNLIKGGFEPATLSNDIPNFNTLKNIYNKAGYDAIARTGKSLKQMGEYREILVFNPNQIKSATGNRGTFDESANIDSSKYQSEWAALSKERMESLLNEGIYHGTDNDWRTRSWIAQVDPRKFVEATTTSAEDIKRIEKRAGKLNLTKLREENQTPFIYIENGEITGHEGRHRMIALAKAGITRVPVVVRQRGEASNKYRQDFMELKGQKFDGSGRGKTLEVYNAIPLNMAERNTARQEYTKDNELRSIEFSRINAEEDQRVLDDLGVPAVPSHDQRTFKEFLLGGWKKTQETAVDVYNEPKENTSSALAKAGEFVTLQRIRNVWYGAGLDAADFSRYAGQIRDAFGRALPSVALKNAIKSAYISTRVILDGGLEMNTMHGIFMAVKKAHSMANIFTMEANLRKDIGTELADRVINSYFVAKRSRGIQERYFEITKEIRDIEEQLLVEEDQDKIVQLSSELESAKQDLKNIKIAYEKIPAYLCKIDEDEPTIKTDDGKEIPNVLYDSDGLPELNDEAMDALINQEEKYSDLTEMMTNWTAVNHNMLDMMAYSGRISKKMADKLKAIKDYSPWARIIDERQDLYDARLMSTRTSGIKHFKAGRTELDVDNVIEAMTNNVQQMVKSTLRSYTYNRIAIEYGSRKPSVVNKKTGEVTPGKLRVFPDEGRFAGQGVRIPIFANGKRIIIQIEDSNVAEAMLGLAMGPINFPLQNVLSAAANFTRRSVTFSLYFQAKQVFYDAPTAAWVSGVRNPLKLWAGCFSGFARAVNPMHDDATAQLLQSAGFGGFQSHHRSAKGELQLELGILNHSLWSKLMKGIDKFGDASDLSQRIPIYEQTLAETGDPMLAILKASDVMDFQKSGNGKLAQALKVTVTFIQAWATQLDALGQAMTGGNIKGMTRNEARAQFVKTGMQLASVCLLYAMLSGGDDDYWELDDETRMRNFYIPGSKKVFGHHVLIPMHSSASFFFKVMPEWLYSTITSQSTKNAIDATRFRKVLAESAVNSILGPTPIPSGAKPMVEIAFNHDFYTGNTVTPRGLENLDAAQQYNASTSELGKMLSSLTGTDKTRLLNPIEADKFMRGMAGSIASLSQYYSNVLNSGNRVMPQIKDNPLVGGLVGADTQRKYENLFYGLRDETESAEATFKKLHERGMHEEADAYLRDNIELVKAQGYVKAIGEDLGRLNKEIKRVGESPKDKTFNTPQKRLDRINELKEIKNNILKDVVQVRKQAGL